MKTLVPLIILVFCACQSDMVVEEVPFDEVVSPIPATEQRDSGDPNAGFDYIITGDYISSGFPYDFFIENLPLSEANELMRSGINERIPFSFNAVQAPNGVDIVAPNCFQCHAQYLDGEFILGLGNYDSDYIFDQSFTLTFADQAIGNAYGTSSLEWEAYQPFSRASKVTAPYLVTEVRGVNPADKLAAVLAAHRDPKTLEWIEDPKYEIPEGLVPTDVPALWLMKKKNALYYTASGRGDQARLMSLAEILTMPDTTKAREVDENFTDLYAFLRTIQAPKYPKNIDQEMAATGKLLFEDHCSKCHGTSNYPNLLVELDHIGTDPELAIANFGYRDFQDWYNSSWYSKGANSAFFEGTSGYIAPPLDGVWATAPYLHNGSVPDLETLLDSGSRPEFWKRVNEYDHASVGWKYNTFTGPAGKTIYDTTKKGYDNGGHTFGDVLTAGERSQVIEYLKTL